MKTTITIQDTCTDTRKIRKVIKGVLYGVCVCVESIMKMDIKNVELLLNKRMYTRGEKIGDSYTF